MFHGMNYIYAVYKEGSFSKAAKSLFISQPSLSATVKRIEEKVGYPIFDRSTKPLQLTEPGRQYIRTVEKLMSVENDFTEYINDWGGLQAGNLTLGGSSLFSSWVLPPLMAEFSRKFPLVKLKLKEENTTELTALLQDGKIDLMLDNGIIQEENFSSCIYQEEHLLLAVPASFSVNSKLSSFQTLPEQIRDKSFLNSKVQPVPLMYFEADPFIILKPENDTRKRGMGIFKENQLTPKVLFELDQQMTSYNITCSGMGISFISDTLISRVPYHNNVIFYKLSGQYSHRSIYFYWKKGRYLTRAMEEFLSMAQEKI